MHRFFRAALVGAALLVPVLLTPVVVRGDDHKDDRKYHDKKHRDDHQWNAHEDQAYHMWAKENHRKEADFARLKDRDQQAYWSWRHNHSDALLKIEIR